MASNNGPGWSGTPAVAPNGQASNAGGSGCSICQNPVAFQGLFIGAVVLILVAWHFHLRAILEV